jgi:hypothetical protein
VELIGLEPTTSSVRPKRSPKLSYSPISAVKGKQKAPKKQRLFSHQSGLPIPQLVGFAPSIEFRCTLIIHPLFLKIQRNEGGTIEEEAKEHRIAGD